MEFGITMIYDINSVIDTRSMTAMVHIVKDKILVSDNYKGHEIVTLFMSDGVMRIFKTSINNFITTLNNEEVSIFDFPHILYDIHWDMVGGDPKEGYRKRLDELIGK